jgi:hypothetical protein
MDAFDDMKYPDSACDRRAIRVGWCGAGIPGRTLSRRVLEMPCLMFIRHDRLRAVA